MAKAKSKHPDDNPPKARRATARRRKTPVAVAARRVRARRAVRRNPEGNAGGGWGGWDFGGVGGDLKALGAGVGAYGATRVLQRLAAKFTAARKPTWTKHVVAATGILTSAAAMLGAKRVKAVAHYHDALVLGTGVAAVQGVVAAYVPRFAWLMSDVTAGALPAGTTPSSTATSDDEPTDYLEQQLQAMEREMSLPKGQMPSGPGASEAVNPNLLDTMDDDESISDLYSGTFSDPTLFAN